MTIAKMQKIIADLRAGQRAAAASAADLPEMDGYVLTTVQRINKAFARVKESRLRGVMVIR
jgi:hypothetical protein